MQVCGKGTTWEGGVRVPAFFYWKTMINPGKSDALISAMDIVPTVMSVVGHPIQPRENLAGLDQSKVIFKHEKSIRSYLAQYGESPKPEIGIRTMIWQHFKAHFYTEGNSLSDDDNYDPECPSFAVLKERNPPLLYDLNQDPGERYPLKPENNKKLVHFMKNLRDKLNSSIPWAPSEMAKGSDPSMAPCCSFPTGSCQPFPQCCNCQFPLSFESIFKD